MKDLITKNKITTALGMGVAFLSVLSEQAGMGDYKMLLVHIAGALGAIGLMLAKDPA